MEPLESLPVEPDPSSESPARPSGFRPNRLTSGIVAGGAALAMVLAGLGIASAQTDNSTTTPPSAADTPPAATAEDTPKPRHGHHPDRIKASMASAATALGITEEALRAELAAGKSIAAVAADNNVAVDKVVAAMVADANTRLDQAVAEGKLTKEQADARRAKLTEHITNHVNRTRPAGDGQDRKRHAGHKAGLGATATALGVTEEALRAELQAGKSIATIAGDKGIPVADVITALVAEANTRLDQAVAEGKLTKEQADARRAKLTEHITNHVNRTRPEGEGRRGPGHGPGRGPRPEAEPTTFDA